jgi:Flp pilus assembly protein TadG
VKRNQHGATAVEFALVLLVFLMFVLGIVDFSRMLYTWNAATEATRAGARYAVVCDDTFQSAAVLAKMQQTLPHITSASVTWSPSSCTSATCQSVTVSITGLNYQWISPLPGAIRPLIPMQTFSTTLTREVMRQDPNSPAICS